MKKETFEQIPFGVPLLCKVDGDSSGRYAFRVGEEVYLAPGNRNTTVRYCRPHEISWVRLPADVEQGEEILIQDPPEPPPDPMPIEPEDVMAVRIVDVNGVLWAKDSHTGLWTRQNKFSNNPSSTPWINLLGRGPLNVKVYENNGNRVKNSYRILRWTPK